MYSEALTRTLYVLESNRAEPDMPYAIERDKPHQPWWRSITRVIGSWVREDKVAGCYAPWGQLNRHSFSSVRAVLNRGAVEPSFRRSGAGLGGGLMSGR